MNRALTYCLLVALAACVSVPRANPLDFSSTDEYNVGGLTLRLPHGFKKFDEKGAELFRPEPPIRPSPGVLVLREDKTTPDAAFNRAYQKIYTAMGGMPLAIQVRIDGRLVPGLHDQLSTHFIWIYVIPGAKAVWTLQIAAPVEWTDAQVLSFHDQIVGSVHLTEETAK
jgi:hypothetical protein